MFEMILAVSIPTVGFIVWLVRLEGKVKQNEKDIDRIEIGWINTNKELLISLETLKKTVNELNTSIHVFQERIEHMNRKQTLLERDKLGPILEEYIKRHE